MTTSPLMLARLKRELAEYKTAMRHAHANFLIWSGGKPWSAELTQIIKDVIAETEAEIAQLEGTHRKAA